MDAHVETARRALSASSSPYAQFIAQSTTPARPTPTQPQTVPQPRPRPKVLNRSKNYDNSLHKKLVADLISQGATEKGFRVALMKTLGEESECFVEDQEDGNKSRFRQLVPDAFRIDEDSLLVTCYEVEVTAQVKPDKIRKYINIWWALDGEDEWNIDLVIVDRFGNQQVLHIVDLAFEELAKLKPATNGAS